ncbi:GAS2-like protein 2A [Polyodon spathula]|uniref:GAS2-like protein 2A n=1 Tax=Polyodon spathula TaxID=7913 RepID=UPI001B7F0C6F|nr:GAS2-like protein 2A [Polyodon spathula]
MSGVHSATKSIRPFRSSEEYLYAMKEDLAEWLKDLYGVEINVDTFLEVLETGSLLCHHANSVTQAAAEFLREYPSLAERMKLPRSGVTFVSSAQPATFLARDNISNFINWSRNQMHIKDVLMFETDDLVLRKNEKHFVLCLLEVARRASRFGMAAPVLIQLEEEIEEEIREELDLPPVETPKHKPLRRMSDFKNLDQMVQYLVSRCTCPSQFPMVKVSEGKYQVGDSSTLIFVRILRNHVMVRVGGGWDTLEHYLDKHDPCRCTSLSHKQAMRFGSPQRPVTPVHEIKTRLAPRQEGHGKPQSMLLLSRSQSPMPAVEWTPSAPSKGLRLSSTSSSRLPASSPDGNGHNTGFRTPGDTALTRVTERSATPSRRQLFSERQAGSLQTASTRTGRDKCRTPPSPGLGGSLPRPAQPASGPRLEPQRSRTPLGFQRAEPAPQQQQNKDSRLAQTWTKFQFSESKTKQTPNRNSMELPVNNPSRPPTPSSNSHTMGGLTSGRPSTPNRCRSPTKQVLPKQEVNASPQTQISTNTVRASSAITRSQSPTKQVTSKTASHPQNRPPTPLGNPNIGSSNGRNDGNLSPRRGLSVPRQNALRSGSLGSSLSGSMIRINVTEPGDMDDVFQEGQPFERLKNNHNKNTNRAMNRDRETAGEMERGCLFTPPPISPEQESELYRSLEDEILSNMQILDVHSDENNNTEDAGSEIPLGQNSTVQELSSASRLSVLASVPSAAKAARSQRTSTFSVSSAEGSRTPQTEPSFDAVIAELSRGQLVLNKVDVESWVAKILPKPIGQVEPGTATFRETRSMDSSSLNVAQSNRMGSWSSLGSSVEFKEPAEARRPDHQDPIAGGPLTKVKSMDTLDGSSTASSGSPDPPVKARTPSFKQKRGLKKPERVPSIYKLKLRSKIRPRRDTRPEKRPSKIPTPVSYRHARSSAADRTSEEAQRKSSPRHPVQVLQGSQSSIPTLYSTEDDLGSEEDVWHRKQSVAPGAKISGRKETSQKRAGDEDEESWV